MQLRPGAFFVAFTVLIVMGSAEVRAQSSCTSDSDCNDGNFCTVDHCDPVNGCVHQPANCDDGIYCTVDLCDPSIGCTHLPAVNIGCVPENRCYDVGRCSSGVCAPIHYACDDSNLCTDDICDPSTGCSHVDNSALCSDDNPCTTGDYCAGGTCHTGPGTRNCNDNNICTDDSCDPTYILGCRNAYNTAPCSDGNPCTTGDACASGFCHPGTGSLNCDDGNPCTNDSCTTGVGCVHANWPNLCLDGDACTLGDYCVDGACHPGAESLDCNDNDACTDDSCNPASGCVHHYNGSCTVNPKTVGYWTRVCRGTGNAVDAITASDVSFMQVNSCGLVYLIHSTEDICRILSENRSDVCFKAEQEFIALTLNLSHGRVSFTEAIDSSCSSHTTVSQTFNEADVILCTDHLASDRDGACILASCECKEINQGRALHVHALVASRLADGVVRLTWIPPVADPDDPITVPRRYRVWRATDASGPFMQIGEVTETTFDDTAAVGERLVYDVTPVW